MIYFIVSHFWKLMLRISRGLKIFGRENVPKKGAFLFVSNHLSNNDPFLLTAGTSRRPAFMAKESLFSKGLTSFIFRQLGAFPINRDADPREVLNKAVEFLKSGRPTVMFPEGTRNKVDERLQPFKKGASLVALKAGVPVVPAAILGTNRKDGPLGIIFGKPMMPPENTRENIVRFNEEMEAAVAELIEDLRRQLY